MEVRPKARILDVYGSFARGFGGWISISALVDLMGEFDVEPHSVRSAIARLKRRGLVEPDKRDGMAGYRLTDNATAILDDGDGRIFRNADNQPDRTWVVALFSVPEPLRNQRYVVRSRLARLGFAQGPAGSWFAPASVVPETKRMLEREELSEFVSLWAGDYLGDGDIRSIVAEAWDLDEICQRYEEFIELASKVHAAADDHVNDPRRAFIDYLDVIAAWRPLPSLAPGLPAEVTPAGWPADEARALFADLHRRLRPPGMHYYVSVALAPMLMPEPAALRA